MVELAILAILIVFLGSWILDCQMAHMGKLSNMVLSGFEINLHPGVV